jgi:4-amino-4-deoxy-L-arabinose transferase-like glycosyltransferase
MAETGNAVSRVGSPQSAYSDAQILAMEAVRHSSTIEVASGRPPWREAQERAYHRQLDEWPGTLSRSSGGGFQQATSSHSPLFYALASPAYLATESLSVPSQVTAIRLFTCLLAALTALFAYLTMRELMPQRQWAAVLAGLFVAFQPMFGFIGGAINNDNGINTAAALITYLLIRGLRRGLTWRLALALGAVLAIAPIIKGTGYFFYPVAAVALLGMLLRGRDRRVVLSLVVVAVTGIACIIAWGLIAPTFGRTVITAPSGNDATADILAVRDPIGYVAYVWQLFFPPIFGMVNIYAQRLPFVSIYVVRGWGAFGWYAIVFPLWMTAVISVVLGVVTAMMVKAMWHFRALARRFGWEALVLFAIPIGVFLGVEAVYASNIPRPGPVAEQGRYIFPAAVSLAAGTVVACFAFGRRYALQIGTVLLVALIGLSLYSRVLEIAGFYT